MKFLIAGLGNIGDEYKNTRHNIGFDVLDKWAAVENVQFTSNRYADYAEIKFKGKQFHLIKPTTYMNLSGKAVKYWLQNLKIGNENLLVVLDDLALPLGKLRLKAKGSDAGHNGLKNIDELLGNNVYARLKFGIGNEFLKGRQVDYVLGKFDELENKTVKPKIEKSIEMIKAFGTIGIERTMNFYNE
jgi:PTH1 family peptidyl-tRNA hydrolase